VLWAAGLAVAVAVILFSLHSYRHRFVRDDRDILGLLPGGDVTTFFASVSALRSAGMLELLAGSKAAEETDYKQFVKETQFDYTKDLETVAGTADKEATYFVARGHFDWSKLRQYAMVHGGSCREDVCKMPTSTPERWTSFLPIQPDVLGVALSPNAAAAELLRPTRVVGPVAEPSTEPVWVEIAPSLLKNPLSLPLAVRIFAVSLQSVGPVIFSLGRAAERSGAVFNVQLDAQCPSQATAEATRNQMEIQTKMLRLELARENAQPSFSDLTGLLTAGSFQVIGKRVVGTWPVRRELLNVLK